MSLAPGPQIGLDGSSVVGKRTGIGRATTELLEALIGCWPESWPRPVLWINSPREPLPTDDPWFQSGFFDLRHTRWPGRVMLRGWQYLGHPKVEKLAGPLDLIHSPSGYICPCRQARRIVTVHDVYFRYHPEHVEPYGGGYFAQTYPRGLRHVDRVIAISEFTRRELERLFQLDPDRMTVIPMGVNHAQYDPTPASKDPLHLQQLGIQKPYYLCVATLEPRKNLPRLIEAWRIRRARTDSKQMLVIAGQHGWGTQEIVDILGSDPHDDIILTDYLPGEALPALYRGARGFVLPSHYEGFGLPVLEALACGCPVAVSNAASLPEVGGPAAIYFDPDDPRAIAAALDQIPAEGESRAQRALEGIEWSHRFTWTATARKTLGLYREVLGLN